MKRVTGTYGITVVGKEKVKAFIPHPLPPKNPSLVLDAKLSALHNKALAAIDGLAVAGDMVPSADWFLYGYVRKEALISSQIEGTQATLLDVLTYEATSQAERPADAEEVCNYIEALAYARAEIAKPKGLPLCVRLLCEAHRRLLQGARGSEKQPGVVRTTQNWIGGARPGTARFVPPPPDAVPDALSALERWIHTKESLPPLVRAGLAHVQFETIHPFLDGNGRIGRLLVSLLIEHWGLLKTPLLYLSLAFKRHRDEYYRRLLDVRNKGDWEGWTAFYLRCVCEAAEDGVSAAKRIFSLIEKDRRIVTGHKATTIPAVRLFDLLPEHPTVTVSSAMKLTRTSKPTSMKAIDALQKIGVLKETTGKRRDRMYAYAAYLKVLSEDTGAIT